MPAAVTATPATTPPSTTAPAMPSPCTATLTPIRSIAMSQCPPSMPHYTDAQGHHNHAELLLCLAMSMQQRYHLTWSSLMPPVSNRNPKFSIFALSMCPYLSPAFAP
jgi:hypothetical protein